MASGRSEQELDTHSSHHGLPWRAVRGWALAAVVGGLLGLLLSVFVPAAELTADGTQQATAGPSTHEVQGIASGAEAGPTHAGELPVIPLWLCAPFGLLLLCIAVMPLVLPRLWHARYPEVAVALGTMVLSYVLLSHGSHGREFMLHAGVEYYSFMALVGGLYIASGGILLDIRVRGGALTNTALLAAGCVLANIVGTTGASVLLIRPFLRMNEGRMRPMHAVFFIFIVSNCAGCLTPIGDPPLYLGFIKGVPFSWTLTNLWPMWLMVNAILLAMFFAFDSRVPRAAPRVLGGRNPLRAGEVEVRERVFDETQAEAGAGAVGSRSTIGRGPVIVGLPAMAFIVLLVAGVFVDPLIKRLGIAWLAGLPVGATFQIAMAACAYAVARPSIRRANEFTFEPIKEVGFLFFGIFLTMAPALEYLGANASRLGLTTPTQYYLVTGVLSAFLDNAPTYASMLQTALGVLHLPVNAAGIAEFLRPVVDGGAGGADVLRSISLGAVFFGAMTYIGNGPNFMVKSIVESAHAQGDGKGTRMPSFFGYLWRSVLILLPVLGLVWAVFIR